MTTPACILVAMHHDLTRRYLADNLAADGYRIDTSTDLEDAGSRLIGHALVLADLAEQTLELVDLLASRTPVVVLVAGGDELSRVRLLERGADDVAVKPCSYVEIRSRIAAVLRRCDPAGRRQILIAGPLTIDRLSRRVHVDGEEVHVSDLEFRLLAQLASDPTRVFTRAELMRDVWGYQCEGRSRTLDSHACRLRRRLGAGLIENVWGVGYRLIA